MKNSKLRKKILSKNYYHKRLKFLNKKICSLVKLRNSFYTDNFIDFMIVKKKYDNEILMLQKKSSYYYNKIDR